MSVKKFISDENMQQIVEILLAKFNKKSDKAATLEGYGIKDAYTKAEIDELIARLQESEEGHFFKAEENEF